ncbi:MAG: cobalamin B12-binding domain protein [Phycisphaera sp.]|nr:cobalamin B12-binding domain protein [Phycisphaera sp.]
MRTLDLQFAESIDSVSRALAEWTVATMYERNPALAARYGAEGRALWRGEVANRLQYLAEAVAADRVGLLVDSVAWARAAFTARGMDEDDLVESLVVLEETLRSELPKQIGERTSRFLGESIRWLRHAQSAAATTEDDGVLASALDAPGADSVRARDYLRHLLERQQSRAVDTLLDAVRSGRTVAEVYEAVIAPALAEVGRMWHLGEATVADEHYVTTATQAAIAVLRGKLPQAPRHGKRALATSVGGDLHDIGIRMVADLLESEGWQVDCLGANMPTADLVEHAVDEMGRQQFHLILLSASTGLAVRATAGAIAALRAASTEARVPIMVGGGVFTRVDGLWQAVGADGCAKSASDSVRLARELTGLVAV